MASVKVSEVTEDQVRYFRARRGHLVGDGAASVAVAAKSILGAQSQQVPPSLFALSQRTAGRPTAEDVRRAIYGESRTLVRAWGQRDTIHLYGAKAHWNLVAAADMLWSPGGRGGPMPTDAIIRKGITAINKLGQATRADFLGIPTAAYVKAVGDRAKLAQTEAKRFAAGRVLWRLVHGGHACIAEKVKTEQAYASRDRWFPELAWPETDPTDAAIELMRDYLAVYGPATPHDIAHFFGAKVTLVRQWIDAIESELTTLRCEHRENLLLLSKDLSVLRQKPPSVAAWPVRFLPLWESMLMGHADKSWTVPNENERKEVWRKAAMVSAVVIDRGVVVARWTHKATKKTVKVQIEPLSRWRKTKHIKGTKLEAQTLAAHLEVPNLEVSIND